jgi:hypothetical protein
MAPSRRGRGEGHIELDGEPVILLLLDRGLAAWLFKHQPLPGETRSYVAIITGWTADEWASANPPKTSDTTIPQGVPCTRLANLIVAVPRWGMQLTANYSERRLGDVSADPEAVCVTDR